MIVITGAAGFIGSCMVGRLNREGFNDLVLVDDFSRVEKKKNWTDKKYTECVEREHFFEWASDKGNRIQFIFHLGARTNTTEFDKEVLRVLNFDYSKHM